MRFLYWLHDNFAPLAIALGVVFGVAAGTSELWAPGLAPSPSVERQTVALSSSTSNDDIFCAGVIVDADKGLVLTAAHCVADEDAALFVHEYDGSWREAEVLWRGETMGAGDLALLRVDLREMLLPNFEIVEVPFEAEATISPDRPMYIGEDIEIVGMPLGNYWFHTYGRVAGDYQRFAEGGGMQLPIDVLGGPGSSGGPAFDADGHLVGIVVAMMPQTVLGLPVGISGPGSMLYMVPIGVICDFLVCGA